MTKVTIGSFMAERYDVTEAIGAGGFGAVFAGVDRETGERVAIKVLKEAADERRFEIESRALAELDHPNCAKVLDSGIHGGQAYIVMEFVAGETLGEWLHVDRSLGDRMLVALQLARALQHAHARGVIHRDFKPDNVLIARRQEWAACVVDFGLAKLVGVHQSDITKTGEVIGTPGFMSPEQLRGLGEAGPKTDMYCLGVTLYEIFEGQPPFSGQSAFDVCMRHLQDEAPTMRNVEGELARLVAGLMDKNPRRRPSATATVRRLERMLGLRSTRPIAPVVKQQRGLIGAVVGAVALGASIWFLAERESSPPSPPPPAPPAPPAPPPRSAVLSPPSDASARPVARQAPQGAQGPTAGCGTQLQPGRQVLWTLRGLERDEVEAYIPDGYEPSTPHPVIIALHEGRQSPDGLFRELDMARLADRLDAVVVAPDGRTTLHGSWKVDVVPRIAAARAIARRSACIDPARVVLLGHGVGSLAGLTASCASRFAALVMTNKSLEPGFEPCQPETAVPLLHILVDEYRLPGGCMPPKNQSVAEHESLWRARNDCGASNLPRDPPHGRCRDWDCAVPLTTCVAVGGVHWREGFAEPCDGPPSPFDYHAEIAAFLEPVLAKASRAARRSDTGPGPQ